MRRTCPCVSLHKDTSVSLRDDKLLWSLTFCALMTPRPWVSSFLLVCGPIWLSWLMKCRDPHRSLLYSWVLCKVFRFFYTPCNDHPATAWLGCDREILKDKSVTVDDICLQTNVLAFIHIQKFKVAITQTRSLWWGWSLGENISNEFSSIFVSRQQWDQMESKLKLEVNEWKLEFSQSVYLRLLI